MKSVDPIRSKYRFLSPLLLTPALLLAACGDSGTVTSPPAVDPIVNETSTDDIKSNASMNIGGSLDSSLDGVSRVTSGSSDGFEDPADIGVGGLWNEDAQNLVNTSLDLDNGDNTTRDGTRITIDPDDAAVCSEELVDMSATDAEFQRCQALVSDMIVQLDATSDTDGAVTYLFQSQPLAVIGYTENSNSFEINLGTLKLLIEANNDLDPEGGIESPLDTMQGALRMFAEATNTTNGSEAGTVALQVSQPLVIASADAVTSLSMGAGTILSLSADAAAESATIEVAIGALQVSDSQDNEALGLNMDGLTAIIDFENNVDQLVVRNLGVGDGPLRIALNNSEVLNLGLETFGFILSANDTTGESVITLDGQMNLRFLVRQIVGDNTVSDTLFDLLEMTAPAGTQIGDQLNGSIGILSGGPLSYSLTTQDENGNQVVDQLTVDAGQCADDIGSFNSDYEIVACQ